MARDNSFAHSTNAPASTANATRNRHYRFIRHYLFFRHFLSLGRRGRLVLIVSKVLRPRIADETAQLRRWQGRELRRNVKSFKENQCYGGIRRNAHLWTTAVLIHRDF
jgi:hypothetical protein